MGGGSVVFRSATATTIGGSVFTTTRTRERTGGAAIRGKWDERLYSETAPMVGRATRRGGCGTRAQRPTARRQDTGLVRGTTSPGAPLALRNERAGLAVQRRPRPDRYGVTSAGVGTTTAMEWAGLLWQVLGTAMTLQGINCIAGPADYSHWVGVARACPPLFLRLPASLEVESSLLELPASVAV